MIARAGEPADERVPHRRADVRFGTAAGLIAIDDGAFDWPDDESAVQFSGTD